MPSLPGSGTERRSEPSVVSQEDLHINLNDVCGLAEVKQEIADYIDYFQNRDLFIEMGCTLPKGLLFVGPPGTGKTLMAKAIAKESKCSFINVEVSTLNEVYVGVGAARMKKIFDLARESKPCIIFMDEIDTIGGRRNSTSNTENTSILNHLLTELDGFNVDDDIMVIAATNREEFLDPALLRSGRFDSKIQFDLPDKKERTDMFEYYVKRMKYVAKNIDFAKIARKTPSCSGADIRNIVNRAGILAIQRKHNSPITEDDIIWSIDRILIGAERKSLERIESERTYIAHHEAGHALISYVLDVAESPIKVSTIPRAGGVLGYSQSDPKNRKLYHRDELYGDLLTLMGGRAAEEVMFDTHKMTTGASDDIQRATAIVHSMFYQYSLGMKSRFLSYIDETGAVSHYLSDAEKDRTNEAIVAFQNKLYTGVIRFLTYHKDSLQILAKKLMETDTLEYDDIKRLLPRLENTMTVDDIIDATYVTNDFAVSKK
jgi:ATP-dependent metalloprotease FtsH